MRALVTFLIYAVSMLSNAVAQSTLSACSQPGANAGQQINNAIMTFVNAGHGGTVDATCYTGTQSITTNMFAGLAGSLPITVELGPATFNIATGAQQYIGADNVTLEGSGTYGTTVIFNDPQQDIFVIPSHNDSIKNLQLQQSADSNKTAGFVLNTDGEGCLFENIKINDPYNGILVTGAFENVYKNIWINTTRTGTLNTGLYVMGQDIDDFFTGVSIANTFPTTDAAVHIRNRASGIRFSQLSVQLGSSTSLAPGILFDCGTSITQSTACNDSYSASPANRPELIHVDQAYVEAGLAANAISIMGGQDIRFSNSYFASSLTGIMISGTSTAISVVNSIVVNMQKQCVFDQAGDIVVGYANLLIQGDELNACSQMQNLTYPAIELAANINSVGILGNHIGHNTFTNFAYDSPVAVKLDGAHNDVRILDNDLTSISSGGANFYSGSPIQGSPSLTDVWMNNTEYPTNNTGIPTTAGFFSSIYVNGSGGFTGTKVAGGCTLIISSGIITSVTGC